jgi:drug/metabolite transporter (DMT)-like permease
MYEFVVTLLQPFTLMYLLLLAATLNLWRKRREKRGRLLFLTLAFVGLTLVCTPGDGLA